MFCVKRSASRRFWILSLLLLCARPAAADVLFGTVHSWKPPQRVSFRLVGQKIQLFFEGKGDDEKVTLEPEDWANLLHLYRQARAERPTLPDNVNRDLGSAGPVTVALLSRPDLRAIAIYTDQHTVLLADSDQFEEMEHVIESAHDISVRLRARLDTYVITP